jgi:hypothetical protein
MHHELKIEDAYYEQTISEEKKCTLRKNDRNFQKWDTLSFTEATAPFFKRQWKWEVTNVLAPPFGLEKGYVILSIKPI